MATAKICLIDFNRWMLANDDDLFSLLNLPTGIDKDTLVGNILLRGGEFECVYSDPSFIQNAIGIWSSKWYRTFDKWVKALAIEYSPLENYDRQESWNDSYINNSSTSGRRDNGNTRTYNNEDKETVATNSENQVSAYDSSSYQPSSKVINGGTDTMNHTGTVTDSFGEGFSSSGNEGHQGARSGRIHGNIGVTTSQQMLQSELELAEWNLYEHITDIFLSEFVIPIYS